MGEYETIIFPFPLWANNFLQIKIEFFEFIDMLTASYFFHYSKYHAQNQVRTTSLRDRRNQWIEECQSPDHCSESPSR